MKEETEILIVAGLATGIIGFMWYENNKNKQAAANAATNAGQTQAQTGASQTDTSSSNQDLQATLAAIQAAAQALQQASQGQTASQSASTGSTSGSDGSAPVMKPLTPFWRQVQAAGHTTAEVMPGQTVASRLASEAAIYGVPTSAFSVINSGGHTYIELPWAYAQQHAVAASQLS